MPDSNDNYSGYFEDKYSDDEEYDGDYEYAGE